MNWIATIAASLALVSQPAKAPDHAPYAHDESLIVIVQCTLGQGSAFKVGWNTYVTANHVSANEGCQIDGKDILVSRDDAAKDYSVIIGPSSPKWLPISCAGFKPGRTYLARGWVNGWGLLALPWIATELTDNHQGVFVGDAIPGMSGGVVLDRKGRATGLVDRRLAARGLPLSETTLCP